MKSRFENDKLAIFKGPKAKTLLEDALETPVLDPEESPEATDAPPEAESDNEVAQEDSTPPAPATPPAPKPKPKPKPAVRPATLVRHHAAHRSRDPRYA